MAMCSPEDSPRCRIINALNKLFEVWIQERNTETRESFLGRDVNRPRLGGEFLLSDGTERIKEEKGVDPNAQKESIDEISKLVKDLLITNQEGGIDRELMRKKSLKISQISIILLEMSMIEGEISDSFKNKLSESISIAFQEILS